LVLPCETVVHCFHNLMCSSLDWQFARGHSRDAKEVFQIFAS